MTSPTILSIFRVTLTLALLLLVAVPITQPGFAHLQTLFMPLLKLENSEVAF